MEVNSKMTTDEINEILSKGGNVTFCSGTYKITDTLILVSNTNVTCADGVMLKQKTDNPVIMTMVTPNTTKYKGTHDVTWSGGKITGGGKKSSNLMEIIHANNIVIQNVVFDNCRYLHSIEIHASQNVEIDNCTFQNHLYKADKYHKEHIQLDFANYDGLGYAPSNSKCYDNTHCKNIRITDCQFKDCTVGIGTHTVSSDGGSHKNITISRNIATGFDIDSYDTRFLNLANMESVEISENTIENFRYGVCVRKYFKGHHAHGGTSTLDNPVCCSSVSICTNNYNRVQIPCYVD